MNGVAVARRCVRPVREPGGPAARGANMCIGAILLVASGIPLSLAFLPAGLSLVWPPFAFLLASPSPCIRSSTLHLLLAVRFSAAWPRPSRETMTWRTRVSCPWAWPGLSGVVRRRGATGTRYPQVPTRPANGQPSVDRYLRRSRVCTHPLPQPICIARAGQTWPRWPPRCCDVRS